MDDKFAKSKAERELSYHHLIAFKQKSSLRYSLVKRWETETSKPISFKISW